MSKRVLVVDDNEDQAETLAVLLDLAGYDTRTEYNGPAALETAREFRPDACVLDIHMPGLDGCGLAKAIREEFGDVCLVAVTGVTGGTRDRRVMEAGFRARYAKPADPNELIYTIATATR
jgi:two-component system OmpR family response regulator